MMNSLVNSLISQSDMTFDKLLVALKGQQDMLKLSQDVTQAAVTTLANKPEGRASDGTKRAFDAYAMYDGPRAAESYHTHKRKYDARDMSHGGTACLQCARPGHHHKQCYSAFRDVRTRYNLCIKCGSRHHTLKTCQYPVNRTTIHREEEGELPHTSLRAAHESAHALHASSSASAYPAGGLRVQYKPDGEEW